MDTMKYKEKRIDDIGLPESIVEILMGNNINTLEDLLKCSNGQLLSFEKLGKTKLNIIIGRVHELGFEFDHEIEQKKPVSRETSVEYLGFSTDIVTALFLGNKRMITLGQLLQKRPEELEKYDRLGRTKVDMIIKRVHELGFQFEHELDEHNSIGPNMLIMNMGFSKQIQTSLERAGIKTLGQLLKLDVEEMKKYRNLSGRRIGEIIIKVHELGEKFEFEIRREEEEKKNTTELDRLLTDAIGRLRAAYQELKARTKELNEAKERNSRARDELQKNENGSSAKSEELTEEARKIDEEIMGLETRKKKMLADLEDMLR